MGWIIGTEPKPDKEGNERAKTQGKDGQGRQWRLYPPLYEWHTLNCSAALGSRDYLTHDQGQHHAAISHAGKETTRERQKGPLSLPLHEEHTPNRYPPRPSHVMPGQPLFKRSVVI